MATASVTLGIDLAAQNAKTAACVIEWYADRAVARAMEHGPRDNSDEWLLDLARGADAIGIDAPFGWPEAFAAAVHDWSRGAAWPVVRKRELTFRRTDVFVADAVGRVPLSVSSDKIAVTAWRCAGLLDRLFDERGGARSRTGESNVFEVYPGAALYCWGLERSGYKARGSGEAKRAGRAAREELLKQIGGRARWLDVDAVHERCVESDDALDALIASLVTRAAALGLTREPSEGEDRRVIEREGWIHLPSSASPLEALLG